ncbi:MAG: hypothetical protein ACKVLN_10195, partial [Rhodobacterales bacterium]
MYIKDVPTGAPEIQVKTCLNGCPDHTLCWTFYGAVIILVQPKTMSAIRRARPQWPRPAGVDFAGFVPQTQGGIIFEGE